ncbi:hypothetical protein A3K81_00595 [Candidatus Bathyarchaeota archaeon RBG_13_60_20]|nr:MAG: hypothetical protein A3K81_00595 [Candidatus Bathyarchaeota archaeon RBG_13_60_20]
MDERTKRAAGWATGILLGLVWGYLMGNLAIGVALGMAFGSVLSKRFVGEEPIKDKKTRRMVMWLGVASMVAGAVAYGYLTGDLVSGLSAGIGLSFVVGLKWEKLYDERMSAVFSKAARNAFVVVCAGFSFLAFFDDLAGLAPWLAMVPVAGRFAGAMYASWAIFIVSWVYHSYLKGE